MTRSPAVRVPARDGEVVRRRLLAEGRLRTDLRVKQEGEAILLPIIERSGAPLDVGEQVVSEFPEVHRRNRPRRYGDLVDAPAPIRANLPRSFDVIGDIVLVRVPSELDEWAAAIGDALLRFVPRARIVGRDMGVHGPERRRSLHRLAGRGGWETVHHENGVAIRVDVERAYFSPRLGREHAQVAQATRPGEAVYDLCCGVGPFSLTLARAGRASHIVAVDRNPAAIALLRESLRRARGSNRVEPVEADVAAFLTTASPADRAILNLPHEGIKYLTSVADVVRPGGAVHYYEVVARDALVRRTEEIVHEVGGPARWSCRESHTVHPYSPTADLTAFRLVRAGEGVAP